MDISKWPIEKVMQLPDSAFGTRFVLSFSQTVPGFIFKWGLSELSFPDRAVIYSLAIIVQSPVDRDVGVRISLGLELPRTIEQFDTLPSLLPNFGIVSGGRLTIPFITAANYRLDFLRQPVLAQGKKLAVELSSPSSGTSLVSVFVVVAAIPDEVPDFYAGPPTEQLDEMVRLLRIGVKFPPG